MEKNGMATNFKATVMKRPQFMAMKPYRKYFLFLHGQRLVKQTKTEIWSKGQALEING